MEDKGAASCGEDEVDGRTGYCSGEGVGFVETLDKVMEHEAVDT